MPFTPLENVTKIHGKISAINATTLKVTFSEAVTDTTKASFAVTRGTVTENVTTTWNENKTEATLKRTGNFIAGDYTVTVSGLGIAEGKNVGTASIETQRVESVVINTASLQKSATAPLSVDFLDQYGEKANILATDSKLQITAYNVTKGATVNQVAGKFQLNSSTLDVKDEVVVTVLFNGLKATKTLTVVNAATIGSVNLTELVLPTGKTMFTPTGTTNVEIKYTAKNTLNENYSLINADINNGVSFISSDSSILDVADITVDGNNKIHIAKFKKAGTVVLTTLTPATGATSSLTIAVNEDAGAPYSLSLGKTAVDFASGYTTPIYVDMNVVDKYSTAIDAKKIASTDYTVTVDNSTIATVEIETTAGDNFGKLKITPKAGAVNGTSGIVTVTINANGQKATLVATAKNSAVPTSIVTKKDTTVIANMLAGAVQTLKFDVQDQYSNVIGDTATYTVEYTTSDNTIVSIDTPAQQDILNNAEVTVNALKAGVSTVKAQLKKDGVAVAEKAYTITVGANDSTKVTYSIVDIPVLYKAADVDADNTTTASAIEIDTTVSAGYAKEVKVLATDANGSQYVVPSSSIVSITTDKAGVFVAQGTNGKYYIATDSVSLTDADAKVTVSITINADDTVKTITKEVTISKEAPKATAVKFMNEAASVDNVKTAKDVATLSIATASNYTNAIADVNVWVEDQFGGYSLSTTSALSVLAIDGVTNSSDDTVTVVGGNLQITDVNGDTTFTKDNATLRVIGIKDGKSDFITITVVDNEQ